jgi:hypothetical protein
LCFIEEWDKVRNQLTGALKEHPVFGELVLYGTEELRILSATIIAAITVTQGELVSFWPKKDHPDVNVSKFPIGVSSSTWLTMLNEFVHDALLGQDDVPEYGLARI